MGNARQAFAGDVRPASPYCSRVRAVRHVGKVLRFGGGIEDNLAHSMRELWPMPASKSESEDEEIVTIDGMACTALT